jgi:formate dehydrogenase
LRLVTVGDAHVILPPPPALQRPHYDVFFTQWAVRNYANFSPADIPLGPDQLDEWEIILRLAAIFDVSYASAESMDEDVIRAMVEQAVSDPYSSVHGRQVKDIMDELQPRTGHSGSLFDRHRHRLAGCFEAEGCVGCSFQVTGGQSLA